MPLAAARCANCGGEIQLDNAMKSGFCTFCGSKIVVQDAIDLKKVQTEGSVADDGAATLEKLIKNAETFLKLGEFEKSAEVYQRVTDEYPEDWRGWWGSIKALTSNFMPSSQFVDEDSEQEDEEDSEQEDEEDSEQEDEEDSEQEDEEDSEQEDEEDSEQEDEEDSEQEDEEDSEQEDEEDSEQEDEEDSEQDTALPYSAMLDHALQLAPEGERERLKQEYDCWLEQCTQCTIADQVADIERQIEDCSSETQRLNTVYLQMKQKRKTGWIVLGIGLFIFPVCFLVLATIMLPARGEPLYDTLNPVAGFLFLIGILMIIIGAVMLKKKKTPQSDRIAIKQAISQSMEAEAEMKKTLADLNAQMASLAAAGIEEKRNCPDADGHL